MAIINLNKKSKRRVGINITPFVDVMLVLVLVFMTITPMFTGTINVDLPEASSEQSSESQNADPIIITISKDRSIYLADEEIELSQLNSKLLSIVKENKNTRVFVKGDRVANYGDIIEIMSLIKSAGFNKISLVTTPSK